MLCGATTAWSAGARLDRAAERSICTPSQSRYAAPTSFSAVNALAEASSSADSPRAAALAWTASPSTPPSIVSSPPARPPTRAFRVIRAWSGPGIMISTSAAIANVVIAVLLLTIVVLNEPAADASIGPMSISVVTHV